ncbi:Asp23/Gls24 family envelope stress response protein [Actinomycetospora atypica]|uniref:Asp23/Gls24 family envelope stress response protein n=1 Tax=Actinomycetospora atypica TaxID=1290095 RepID=A0ABV9YIP1_9PSEU
MRSDRRLACGADPDALLAQVSEGRGDERDAHQAGCPHCRATLAEYARLWEPFDELAATEVRAPAGLLDRALASVREQAGPVDFGRVPDEQGPYLVAARAIVAVVGHAARSSAGVRMALGALGELVDPGTGAETRAAVGAGVSGQSVAVDLTVAAEYGHDLRRLAEHLRERVVSEVRAQTGLEVVVVDVAITDVFPPLEPPTPPPPRAA